METTNIIENLNKLGKSVNSSARTINAGGCCVFASLVTDHLNAMGIRARGIVANYGYRKNSIAVARKCVVTDPGNIDQWNQGGIAFNHVAVEFFVDGKRYHYDTNGVVNAYKRFRGDIIENGRLKPKELKALADNADGWNSEFDRDLIPEVKKLVDKFLPV